MSTDTVCLIDLWLYCIELGAIGARQRATINEESGCSLASFFVVHATHCFVIRAVRSLALTPQRERTWSSTCAVVS